MNKIDFQKLEKREDMIIAFNDLKNDYRQLFAINDDLQQELQRKDNIINELKKICNVIIKEHNNGEYNVSTTQLAIQEHKENIQIILDIIKELESK